MPQAKGANAQVCIQEETTPNVNPVTPDLRKLHFESCGLALGRSMVSSATMSGNRNPSKPAREADAVDGPLALELQAYCALLLKAAFGSVATTGASTPYTHTFKIGATLPSLLVEVGYTDIAQYFLYNGVKVGKMAVSLTPKGFQKISFDLIGIRETISGASFDATPTDLGKASFDAFALATIEEAGVAIADIVSLDFTLENDPDGDQYCLGGQGKRSEIPEGMAKVTGTLKARFKDVALYTKAINSTETSLRVLFNLGTGAGTAGNESLEFKLPELVFTPKAPGVQGPKGVVADFAFEAYYDNSAETTAIQAILKNSQATI